MGFLLLCASLLLFSPPLPSPPLSSSFLFKISLSWQWGEALLQIKSHLLQQRALLERLSSLFLSSRTVSESLARLLDQKDSGETACVSDRVSSSFCRIFFLCSRLLVRGKCTCSSGWGNVCFECGWRHWCWRGSASKFHKCSNRIRFQIPNQGIGPIGAQLAVGTSWIISVVANDIIKSSGIPCTL